jgi:hypothetical protein
VVLKLRLIYILHATAAQNAIAVFPGEKKERRFMEAKVQKDKAGNLHVQIASSVMPTTEVNLPQEVGTGVYGEPVLPNVETTAEDVLQTTAEDVLETTAEDVLDPDDYSWPEEVDSETASEDLSDSVSDPSIEQDVEMEPYYIFTDQYDLVQSHLEQARISVDLALLRLRHIYENGDKVESLEKVLPPPPPQQYWLCAILVGLMGFSWGCLFSHYGW